MKKINLLFKKIFAVILLLSFIIPVSFVSALGPIIPGIAGDILPPVPTSDAAIRNKEVGITILGFTIPGVTLDGLMILFVREMIEKLSDATVDWINNRDTDEGGPAFAVDLEGFLKTTTDKIAGNIIEGAGLGALCSPFQNQVREALRLSYSFNKRNADDIEPSCTLSQVTNNIEGFFAGDFIGGGGWDSWFVVSQDPNGNPFSATLTTKGIVARKVSEELNVEDKNLAWSDGFFNSRDCIRYQTSDPTVCAEFGPTKTPGTLIEGQLQKVLGSEIDQLNLADEFDEILAALAGMLMNSVFNRGGIIDNSSLSGRATTGGINNRPLVGGCTPNKASTVITDAETVIWAYVGGQNVSLVWNGEGISGLTDRSVSVVYTTPGTKTVTVQVTRLDANGAPVGAPETIQCSQSVRVDKFAPLAVSCAISSPQVKIGEIGTWTITITGGSGSIANVILGGDVLHDINPQPYDVKILPWPVQTQANGVTTLVYNIRYFFPIPVLADGGNRIGSRTFTLTVIDADTSVPVLNEFRCPFQIAIVP